LELAGARVIAYETFGSYQGDWLAKVEHNGAVKWIHGSYGSCSGCDALEHALEDCEWDDEEGRNQKMKEIGHNELMNPTPYRDIINRFKTDSEWDGDAIKAVEFLEKWGEA
jgi:hypothetical protein